jgi:N-acetylglucosaminyl-diphospho-decaprenol L-rhamnosyltransferase
MSDVVGLTLNYRDPVRTVACVRNLLEQGAEHVLVWDNSADGGESSSLLAREFADDARVSIVDAESNLGFSAGINRGIEWLKHRHSGRAVLLINNDAQLLPGALCKLQSALQRAPKALVAFPDIDHGGWVRGLVWYQRLTGIISDKPLPGSFAYASGCCLLLSSGVCTGPLFDEDFFMYGEDWELGWRLSRQPGSTVHVPEILVAHEGSASSRMGSPFYETRVVAAQLIIARKLAKNRVDGLLVAVLHWCLLFVRALVRSIRFRSTTPIRALREGRRLAG